jgi:hypothetical protein
MASPNSRVASDEEDDAKLVEKGVASDEEDEAKLVEKGVACQLLAAAGKVGTVDGTVVADVAKNVDPGVNVA